MLEEIASLARIEFFRRHCQPLTGRVLLATATAIAGSLAADAILVAIGEAVFPATRGYMHFRFADYAKLTVTGVIIACAAWPIITRVSSAPRWLFFRLAVLVTLMLWLPDLYILYCGQPPDAVAVLILMHLAIALVIYNLLVHMAPIGPVRRAARRAPAHATKMPANRDGIMKHEASRHRTALSPAGRRSKAETGRHETLRFRPSGRRCALHVSFIKQRFVLAS